MKHPKFKTELNYGALNEYFSFQNIFRFQTLFEFINEYFSVEVVIDYGLYLFLSRVYHPLVVLPDQPKHDSKLNEVAMNLANLYPKTDFDKYSYNLFYVFRKKS